jgi:aminoglycoside phosphotransferase (APT) family kinase protein
MTDTTLESDLPPGMIEWAAACVGGEVVRLERHVARREAWIVDLARPDGSVVEAFLRLERDPEADNPWSLEKEAAIVKALGPTSVPVAELYGWSDALHCALFERVRGASDLDPLPMPQRQVVMENFIDAMARVHTLDIDALGLPPLPRPSSARECALGEVDLILKRWATFLDGYREPLITYAVDWLGRNAPTEVSRVSLVQGDTGPGNFVYDGDRVTAVVDWEWGHLGDPLEDLGNLCVRDFWTPAVPLGPLMQRYERVSGVPVDLDSVRYYRIQQNVRGMIPIHAVTQYAHPSQPVAWYLAYRYVGDRATCEAMAQSMGVSVESPSWPDESDGAGILVRAAQHAIDHDIRPTLHAPFSRSRLADVGILLGCVDRLRRFEDAIADAEREDLGVLLGRRPDSVEEGLRTLDTGIRERRYDDDDLIRYLTRRSYRLEWLYAPAVSLYPDRRWASLESSADRSPSGYGQ